MNLSAVHWSGIRLMTLRGPNARVRHTPAAQVRIGPAPVFLCIPGCLLARTLSRSRCVVLVEAVAVHHSPNCVLVNRCLAISRLRAHTDRAVAV